ncbi:helix-turn-helix domain-containing protein [Paraliomyxa miuraensis]|uniref:helix-turn-helix domain-containing protein n=1 Tax=Paraliomyxa miuraensis TaxID=376150 RepID=UPI00225049AA|nr:helix-turn-helix transcriptional regulator [Paraliomyxa miuraensis]MCX4245435.1 helix-turn-helix domain-containing protein [Paraliomyxa miuraensis]
MIGSQAELGQLVKLCREHRGLTQDQLARALELSRTAVAHLEQGLRLPEPTALRRLCEHLGLPRVLWEGFIPHDSLYAMAVHVRCRTYFTEGSELSDEEERRVRLVHAIRSGEPWRDGKHVVEDPHAACAKRQRKAFPGLFLNRTFVPVPPPEGDDDQGDAEWPSLRLSRAYAAEGTACRVVTQFRRSRKLRKTKGRPGVADQLATLVLTDAQVFPGVVLVDDVVDRGSTLLACATRLTKLGWRGQVDALVVAYTRTRSEEARDGSAMMLGWDGTWEHPVRSG